MSYLARELLKHSGKDIHFAGLRQAQGIRIIATHETLDFIEVKVQMAQRAAIENKRLVVGAI